MTDDQIVLKEKIQTAKAIADEANHTLNKLRLSCTHYIKPITSNNDSCSAVCEICGSYEGWYCSESPNHVCNYEHYDEEMGGRYWDEDDCIYCGQPEERK